MATKKVRMVCGHCKSENVKSDAYAAWDVKRQQWALACTFDKGAYCDDCDGETSIEAVSIG
jgi:hypothetical protein